MSVFKLYQNLLFVRASRYLRRLSMQGPRISWTFKFIQIVQCLFKMNQNGSETPVCELHMYAVLLTFMLLYVMPIAYTIEHAGNLLFTT